MMTIKQFKINPTSLVLLLIFFLLSILYKGYVIDDPLLTRDDVLLIEPIVSIKSFTEYYDSIWNNFVMDFQPLRDLSFLLNIKIKNVFGYSTFHLFNLIIFFLSIIVFSKILIILFRNNYVVILGILIFSLHPIMVASVGWVSSRKHSMAFMFLLLSIYDFLKKQRISYLGVLHFFLSSLCHQIYCLYPIWLLIFSKVKKIKINKAMFVLLLVTSWAILFLASYKTFILNIDQVSYTEGTDLISNISRFVLSFSRAVVLVVFPYSISTVYYQGSFWNLIGIPLMVLILYLIYKSHQKQDCFLWISLGALSFLPTYIAFVNDTYLYGFLASAIISLLFLFNSVVGEQVRRVFSFGIWLFIFMFTLKTFDSSQIWMRQERLWQYSYLNEPSPIAAMVLSAYVKDPKDSIDLLKWGAENFDLKSSMRFLNFFLKSVYYSKLETQEKIKVFEECYQKILLYDAFYGLSLMHGDEFQAKKGFDILTKIRREKMISISYHDQEIINKELKKICDSEPKKTWICKNLFFQEKQ